MKILKTLLLLFAVIVGGVWLVRYLLVRNKSWKTT
jgi:hypothetical protein